MTQSQQENAHYFDEHVIDYYAAEYAHNSTLHDEHVTDWMWATSEWVDEQIDEQFEIWATSEWADEDELERYTEHAMNDHDAHVVTRFYHQHKIDEQFATLALTSICWIA